MRLRNGKTLYIAPYSKFSKSAKALSEALGCSRLFGSDPGNSVIINWGQSGLERVDFNKSSAVSKAVNKIATFNALKTAGVRTPEFTSDLREAQQWLREGATVMARTKTNSSSGRGIVICSPENRVDIPRCSLYTKYINKTKEYRVHVFNDKVIDCRRKVPASDGRERTSSHVWTHTNGYVFNFADCPSDCRLQAVSAVRALGLQFGAVDIITEAPRYWGQDKAYVLEVNTAPGLTGTTITNYKNAILKAVA